ncbi:MAG: hypothetical protein ACI94Y_002534 [Maribacter sp.]|jgi:hypothetical protein
MKNSKILNLYLTLTHREKKDFNAFIISPYHNTNESVIKLLEYICLFKPNYDQEEFTKKNAYRFVFQDDKVPITSKIIKLSSKLQKLLEQFIALEQFYISSFPTDYQMLLHYAKHDIENEFQNTYKTIHKRLSKENITIEWFHNQFVIEKEYNRFISTRKDDGVGDVHFNSTIKALDLYYLVNRLIYECQRINRKSIIKGWKNEVVSFLNLEQIKESAYIEVPIVKVWYEAYLLLKTKDFSLHYRQLKSYLFDIAENLPISQKRLLFTYLENKSIRLFTDRKVMYRELFSLYEHQNKHGILLTDEFSVANVVRNFVSVGLKIGKIEAAEAFIRQLENQKGKKRDYKEVLDLSKAYILFEKESYNYVLDILNTLKTNNLYFKIEERRLRSKCYHHLDMHDLNFDALNTFRVFLTENKHKIHEYHLSANRNFITILLRYLKAKSSFKLNTTEVLVELSEMSPIAEKDWLEKIVAVSN